MKDRAAIQSASGLTLVEAIVAMALFTVTSVAAAHLLVWAVRTFWSTGAETVALAAAQSKMEELESLAWRFDSSGNRISDRDTNLAGRTPSSGGPGLAISPANTLQENVDGYVDYLDQHGKWINTGAQPSGSAVFVRRWQVRPLPGGSEDALILQVLVAPLANGRSKRTLSGRGAGESLLTTARTRMR